MEVKWERRIDTKAKMHVRADHLKGLVPIPTRPLGRVMAAIAVDLLSKWRPSWIWMPERLLGWGWDAPSMLCSNQRYQFIGFGLTWTTFLSSGHANCVIPIQDKRIVMTCVSGKIKTISNISPIFHKSHHITHWTACMAEQRMNLNES